jgi:hypothetical protein
MFKIKRKNPPHQRATTPNRRLAVKLSLDGAVEIDYDPANPPHVLFDTNVLRGLGRKAIDALHVLQSSRGFQFRYSMLNFVELVAHLGDSPSVQSPNPFRKFQAPFRKILELFRLDVLPSAEMVLMDATGLGEHLDPKWIVNPMDIGRQVAIIANARSLEEVRGFGIDPGHYKQIKEVDCNSFESMMRGAIRTLERPLRVTESSAKWLLHIYSFLIYRASSKTIRLSTLPVRQQRQVILSFRGHGGKMFEGHLLKLLDRTINDGRAPNGNDFYDMQQLLLLRNLNLLLVTDDRPFFSYYMGPQYHRVVPWKGFQLSASA